MRQALYTEIYQSEVKIVDEKDAPETYAKNLPPGGTDKWLLVQYPDGKRLWTPKYGYSFATPLIVDRTKVTITEASA